jgi:hypothetical protein
MGAEWLRTRLTAFSCAACGRPYRADHINVLAQREDLFFVRLSCRACSSESIAIVTVQVEQSDRPQLEPGELALVGGDEADGAPPIDSDDLLAMHSFLTDFDGDFRGLFGAADGSTGTSGGR